MFYSGADLITMECGSEAETRAIGRRLGTQLQTGDVVTLSGPLGVGKTTLVAGLAKGIGTDPNYVVRSPTFVFLHIYPGEIPLYHIDLYRVENELALANLGLEEMIGGNGITAIEWFDRFPKLWPAGRIDVSMRFATNNCRMVEMRSLGTDSRDVEDRLRSVG